MPKDPQTVNKVVELLTTQYIPYVKEAIVWLETYTGERSKRSVHELRNALDHMAVALNEDTDTEDATKSLCAVEEHFRRAAVEPVEWIALEELQRLLKIRRKGLWWWKLLFLKPVDTDEFNHKIYEGMQFIETGRKYKGVSLKESYGNLKRGYETFHKLLDEIRPAELRSRLFSVAWAFAFTVIGFLLNLLWSWLRSIQF